MLLRLVVGFALRPQFERRVAREFLRRHYQHRPPKQGTPGAPSARRTVAWHFGAHSANAHLQHTCARAPFSDTAVVAASSGASNSANPVVYASTTPTVCVVDASSGVVGLTIAAQAGNTCTLSANQFGRAYNGQNYAPATQLSETLTVSQIAQSLAFGAATAGYVGGTGTGLWPRQIKASRQ